MEFPSLKKSLESEGLSREKSQFLKPEFHRVEYRLYDILYRLDKVNELPDEELTNIIRNLYSVILNYDFFLISDNSRLILQKVFSNKRFLSTFLDNVGCMKFTKHQIVCINKLAYDYYILDDKDKEIQDLLLQISYKINTRLVIILSAKLGMNNARKLSMISNSSFKIGKNIHRTNVFLNKCDKDLSVQSISDVLCLLFGESFTQLFIYTMLEVPDGELTQRFNDISIALLDILNSIPMEDIKMVLQNYAYIVQAWRVKQIRFSFKKLIGYERIKYAISEINTIDMPIP